MMTIVNAPALSADLRSDYLPLSRTDDLMDPVGALPERWDLMTRGIALAKEKCVVRPLDPSISCVQNSSRLLDFRNN